MMSSARVALVLSLTAVLLLEATSAGAAVKFRRYNLNVKGDVVVIALGSLYFRPLGPPFPNIPDVDKCEAACSNIAGCNAWTYCNDNGGCGNGCDLHLATHPKLTNVDPTDPTKLASNTTLSSLQRPGPYELLCSFQNATKWAYGTCSLKYVRKPSKPSFWSNNTGDGWVSGTIETPPSCGTKIAARSCSKCLKLNVTSKASECIGCAIAANAQTPNPVLQTLLYKAAITSDGCANCFSLKSPKFCLECLEKGRTCGGCALFDASPSPSGGVLDFSLADCLSCMKGAAGAKTNPIFACMECASPNTAPKNRPACKKCVSVLKNRFCKLNRGRDSGNGDCVPQQDCSACAGTTTPTLCTNCLKRRPFNQDCEACTSTLPDPTLRPGCLQCALTTKDYTLQPAAGSCYVCSQLPAGDAVKTCVEGCAHRVGLSLDVDRNFCRTCWEKFPTVAGANKCYDCLAKTPVADIPATCGLA